MSHNTVMKVDVCNRNIVPAIWPRQMRADQVLLFEMLEQLDRRVLQNVDDAAQAP